MTKKMLLATSLDDYKLDVTKGAGIKQDIARGLGNAAAHVTNIYGR